MILYIQKIQELYLFIEMLIHETSQGNRIRGERSPSVQYNSLNELFKIVSSLAT